MRERERELKAWAAPPARQNWRGLLDEMWNVFKSLQQDSLPGWTSPWITYCTSAWEYRGCIMQHWGKGKRSHSWQKTKYSWPVKRSKSEKICVCIHSPGASRGFEQHQHRRAQTTVDSKTGEVLFYIYSSAGGHLIVVVFIIDSRRFSKRRAHFFQNSPRLNFFRTLTQSDTFQNPWTVLSLRLESALPSMTVPLVTQISSWPRRNFL